MGLGRRFDPRHVDMTMKDAITVKAKVYGLYQAKRVPPVFGVGPNLADRLLWKDGLGEAVEANPEISDTRKMFL